MLPMIWCEGKGKGKGRGEKSRQAVTSRDDQWSEIREIRDPWWERGSPGQARGERREARGESQSQSQRRRREASSETCMKCICIFTAMAMRSPLSPTLLIRRQSWDFEWNINEMINWYLNLNLILILRASGRHWVSTINDDQQWSTMINNDDLIRSSNSGWIMD